MRNLHVFHKLLERLSLVSGEWDIFRFYHILASLLEMQISFSLLSSQMLIVSPFIARKIIGVEGSV